MSTIFYLHFKEQSRYHHPQETFPAIQIWVRYFSYLILSPLYCYDTGYNSYLIICLSDRLQAFRAQDPSLSTSLVSQSLVQSPHEFWMENTFLNCSSIHFFLVSQMSTGHEGLGNAFSSFPIGGSEKVLSLVEQVAWEIPSLNSLISETGIWMSREMTWFSAGHLTREGARLAVSK